MSRYAPTPLVVPCGVDLYVAFAKFAAGDDGEPLPALYYSHADGGWDATFDWARHARPLKRLGPVGSALRDFQAYCSPGAVAACRDVHALLFQPDGATAYKASDVHDGPALRMYSGGVI